MTGRCGGGGAGSVTVNSGLSREPEPGQLLSDARLAKPGQRDLTPGAASRLRGLAGVGHCGHDVIMFDVTGSVCHCSCWATLTITFLLSTSLSSEHFTSLPSNIKSYFPCNCCINKNVLPINKIYSGPSKYSRSAAISVLIKMKASLIIIQVIILITVWQRDSGD